MGTRFLKVPTITSTERAERVLLFPFYIISRSRFQTTFCRNIIKLSLDKTKWTGLLARNGVCEFRETAPVPGNFRTGPTSPRLPFVALSPSEMSYRREVHPDCCVGARIVFWYAILQLHRVNEELQFVSVWNWPPVKTRTLEVRMYNFRQT